ncbi:MAG: hypothetical protein DCF31_13640 [Alphaproteobacteria bacterium]|nr:MAG: hypothetical protein DCF31_13640 [Alphaproteobacteria bacterium]
MSALLRVLAGLIGWAAGFSILYGLHGIACARGWSAVDVGLLDLQRLVLGLAWLGGVAAIAVWTLVTWRTPPGAMPLLDRLALGSAIAGLFAMIVSGVPIVMTDPCRGDSAPGTVAGAGCCEKTQPTLSVPRAADAPGKVLPVHFPADSVDHD